MEHHHMEHGGKHDHHMHMMEDFRLRFFVSLALSLPVIVLSPLVQSALGYELEIAGSEFILLVLSAVIYAYGGYPFLNGMMKELKQKNPGMMTLIGIATSISFFYSAAVVFGVQGKFFFWELATLIVVMLLGHWMEMRSVLSASRSIQKLAELIPSVAHLRIDGKTRDVKVSELVNGNVLIVKPGEQIPSDGRILDGESEINESLLTGESRPVFRKKDDLVIGGSINGSGSLEVEVTGTGEETYVSKIIRLVQQTQESKSRIQGLADRAALWLTIIGIAAGIVTFAAWLAAEDFSFALERAVTVMVITCPHALGLAIPLVVAVSASLAARNGFLIRNRTQFENARGIDTVVFDKTGTLTEGRFEVSEIEAFGKFGKDEVLKLAASLEALSEHSIGAAILRKAKGMKLKKAKSVKTLPGKGIKGKIESKDVMVASPAYARELGFRPKESKNKTTVCVISGKNLIGSICLEDRIRKESFEAAETLRKMGIKCMMLTGDNEEVASAVARKLSLDKYFAQVLPEKKVDVIKQLQSKGMKVAMVGDGINDAPALVQSDVGIAIGAGTDVAVESADIVLAKNDPRDIPAVIRLSRATYGKMLQNLGWAAGYNVIAIPLAAGILYGQGIVLSPAVGALLMSASTVIVAFNAKLLKL